MKSRQSVLQAFTNKTFDFNKTDEINICAQINQASLNWALNKIPSNTLNRYLNKGKNLVVTDDSPVSTGFKWVTTQLVKIHLINFHNKKFKQTNFSSIKIFKQTIDPKTNRTIVYLGSPTLRTSTSTFLVPGYHYCKLLSPARAVEWMYVDCVKP